MILPHWKRISGLRVQPDGDIACVWLAHDKDADTIHVYDACLFRREVLAVIAEALNARGRWIPVAWNDKAISDTLLDKGCNMLPEAAQDSQQMAEAISRDVWERMRTGRWKVNKRLSEYIEELGTYNRDGQAVPIGTHPLMSATRHAVEQLDYARRLAPKGSKKPAYPKLAII